ncbi:MAG: hypothetical protein KTR31_34395 [Myxococcales bacterium]|nr:hypothetical protein [Myxococcales bacterium]
MTELPSLEGPTRSFVADDERTALEAAGGLVLDARRTRPRYFDGRFLAARDLTADQLYVSTRQADLARAIGSGVVEGLEVTPGTTATEVQIAAGYGLTPSGEATVVPDALSVDLYALQQSELLDGQIGLREAEKTALARSRRGAFVVALRPIAFTANPRRGYPTDIDGERRTEDHDIIEATAVTLVPWPTSWPGGPSATRGKLAREIFVAQQGRGLAADLVPLAMVYLDGVSVSWIDMALVRRAVGADRPDPIGLGVVNRAVRAAHVRQYTAHLTEMLASGISPTAESFDALPPVGPIPIDAVDGTTLTQRFFPAEMDIDLSFVPEDELPALLEEGLSQPAIDLAAGSDLLTGTSVVVLVPVQRGLFRRFKSTLGTVRRPLTRRVGRLPVVRTPLLALSRLRLPSVAATVQDQTPPTGETAPWTALFGQATAALGTQGTLWFARRRNLNHRIEVTGNVVDIDVSSGV